MDNKRSTPDYFIFDCETGGLDGKTDAICELCGVFVNGLTLEVTDTYETIIKPYGLRYQKEALAVHGLTEDILTEHGEEPEQVIAELIMLFEKYNQDKKRSGRLMLVGHNVNFDISFLSNFFSMYGMNLSDYVATIKLDNGKEYPASLDTINFSHLTWPEEKTYKLKNCAEKGGVELFDAHRAMNDVEATYKLFKLFTSRLLSDQGSGGSEKVKEKVKFSFKW